MDAAFSLEPNLIIDALFGIGLTREASGDYRKAIERINEYRSKHKNCRVIAVDIPSGLNSDDGKIMGASVRADETVTFAFPKTGLTTGDGPAFAGTVIVADIGIYERD
jgi:NAD(P)H-hydrate epimerase